MTPPERFERREFLKRALSSAGAVAVTGVGGLLLWERGLRRQEQGRSPQDPSLLVSPSLPDWRVAGLAPRMSIARGPDRARSLARALEGLGGLADFIKPGERVLLKVNAAFATPPHLGATTHPELVSAMVRHCLDAGATSVVVLDHPVNDPASCFSLSGIERAARQAGAQLELMGPGSFVRYTLPGGRLIRDWPVTLAALSQADRLIGMAPVKDHFIAGASLSVKNWYGFLGGSRNRFHQEVQPLLLELARMIRPTLVILDGTAPMMRNGPTGGAGSDLSTRDTLIACTDPIAADAFAATLLEKELSALPYLSMAASAGLGTTDYRSLEPRELPA